MDCRWGIVIVQGRTSRKEVRPWVRILVSYCCHSASSIGGYYSHRFNSAFASLVGFCFTLSFLVVMACIHSYASEEKKVFSLVGLSFAVIYASLISLNYFIQLTFVHQSTFDGFCIWHDKSTFNDVVIELLDTSSWGLPHFLPLQFRLKQSGAPCQMAFCCERHSWYSNALRLFLPLELAFWGL